jgi:hypothetical protein
MLWAAQTTAEHVVGSTDAVTAFPNGADAAAVAGFLDISEAHATAALQLATDLTLLQEATGHYFAKNAFVRNIPAADQAARAGMLRVVLEAYAPFITFRQRWLSTTDFDKAAQQTKQVHQLSMHRDEIRATLISLATFAGIISTGGGGRYEMAAPPAMNPLLSLAAACADNAAAIERIEVQLGPSAAATASRTDVIAPLATALLRSAQADGSREAVVSAANAVESFLFEEGTALNLGVATAPGINAKLALFKTHIPDKLIKSGAYLGHIRNAADHGVDAQINQTWTIRPSTGLEYVFVSCSFIAAFHGHLHGIKGEI